MTRKELAQPKKVLFLLAVVFGNVDSLRWISMNGWNVSSYITSTQAVSIECTISIPDQPGAFISVNQAIWRAVGVSTTLNPSSPLWSVVIDNYNRHDYTPDSSRMTVLAGEHPSTIFMKIGLTIQVPLPNDTGMYICNGSYKAQSDGPLIVENSDQVYLSIKDASASKVTTWITVKQDQTSSYTARLRNTPIDILCNTLFFDLNFTIIDLNLYKAQNFTYDNMDGSGPSQRWSGWYPLNYTAAQWKALGLTSLNAAQNTWQQMSLGVRINDPSPFASGLYKCVAFYVTATGSPAQTEIASTVVSINTNGPVSTSLSVFGTNDDGIQSIVLSKSDIFNVSQYRMAKVVCNVSNMNEIPRYQMFVNENDVTNAVNTAGTNANIYYPTSFEESQVFMSIKYQMIASYELSASSPCSNWTVKCTSWVESNLDQPTTIVARLSSTLCKPKVSANPHINAAPTSLELIPPLNAISWILVGAFSNCF